MKTESNEIRTASRIYWAEECGGIWNAYFRPLNPKNGKPWQATRPISKGEDCHRFWIKGVQHPIVFSEIPPYESWGKPDNSVYARSGYSSEQLALEAIKAEQLASGK